MNSKRSRNIFNNTLVAQIIFIAVVAGVILVFERFFDKEPSIVGDLVSNEAVLFIELDSMQRTFSGEVIEEMTVLDALNASVIAGQIKLVYYVDGGNNTRVAEINDHSVNDGDEFVFYVNSKKADPSELNKIRIRPGDKITIRSE